MDVSQGINALDALVAMCLTLKVFARILAQWLFLDVVTVAMEDNVMSV